MEYQRRTSKSLPGTVEPEGLPPDAFFSRPRQRAPMSPSDSIGMTSCKTGLHASFDRHLRRN